MTDTIGGERRMRRLGHRRAVFRMDLPAARQPTDAVGDHVLGGEDRGHARGLRRRSGVDVGDPRVRVRAAQDVCVKLVGTIDVVGVGALVRSESGNPRAA